MNYDSTLSIPIRIGGRKPLQLTTISGRKFIAEIAGPRADTRESIMMGSAPYKNIVPPFAFGLLPGRAFLESRFRISGFAINFEVSDRRESEMCLDPVAAG